MKVSFQAAVVRDHLYTHPHLTSWQAEGVHRIRRLASRISDLRLAGYEIEKKTCTDATGQRYTQYSFSRRQRRVRRPLHPPKQAAIRMTLNEFAEVYAQYCADVLGLSSVETEGEVTELKTYIQENA